MIKIIFFTFLAFFAGWITYMWWIINKWIFLGAILLLFLTLCLGTR